MFVLYLRYEERFRYTVLIVHVVQSTKLVALRYISLSLQLLGQVSTRRMFSLRLFISYQELEDISRSEKKKKEHVTSVARTASYG